MRRLADVISAYVENPPKGDGCRRALRDFIRAYAAIPTLQELIEVAVLGNHPHQHCLAKVKLRQIEINLQRRIVELEAAENFEEIYALVEACVRPPFVEANLLVYDISLRVGAKRNLRPKLVYLHRGAWDGAISVLGRKHLQSKLSPNRFPREFRLLSPCEIEDCLCIYKDDLEELRIAAVL